MMPPGQPPGPFGPPPGGGLPPGAPYRPVPDGAPPPLPAWVPILAVLALPPNLLGLVLGLTALAKRGQAGLVGMWIVGTAPVFVPLAVVLSLKVGKYKPQWHWAPRWLLGSHIAAGVVGWAAIFLALIGVGLVVAACGGCRR